MASTKVVDVEYWREGTANETSGLKWHQMLLVIDKGRAVSDGSCLRYDTRAAILVVLPDT